MSNSRQFFRPATEADLERMTPWQRSCYEKHISIVGLDASGRIIVADMSPWVVFKAVLVTPQWLEDHAEWLDWRDEYLAATNDERKDRSRNLGICS